MSYSFFKKTCTRRKDCDLKKKGACPDYPCLVYEDCERDARDDKEAREEREEPKNIEE